jgi:hypothetical protein
MEKRSKDHDFATIARSVVERAIGEQLDGSTLTDPNSGKNEAAVALGRLGGKKGGKARAETLTAEQRVEIARKAARKRWSSKKSGRG